MCVGPQTGMDALLLSLINEPLPSAFFARSLFGLNPLVTLGDDTLEAHATIELSGDHVTEFQPTLTVLVSSTIVVGVPSGVIVMSPVGPFPVAETRSHATADESGAQVKLMH